MSSARQFVNAIRLRVVSFITSFAEGRVEGERGDGSCPRDNERDGFFQKAQEH
jgi:hypothetical protein